MLGLKIIRTLSFIRGSCQYSSLLNKNQSLNNIRHLSTTTQSTNNTQHLKKYSKWTVLIGGMVGLSIGIYKYINNRDTTILLIKPLNDDESFEQRWGRCHECGRVEENRPAYWTLNGHKYHWDCRSKYTTIEEEWGVCHKCGLAKKGESAWYEDENGNKNHYGCIFKKDQ